MVLRLEWESSHGQRTTSSAFETGIFWTRTWDPKFAGLGGESSACFPGALGLVLE